MQSPPQPNPEAIRPCPQCGTGVRFRHDPTTDRKSCPQCGYVLPNKIAHFKLVQIIGIGGMGAVYRGMDTSLERQVAVKVMREEFARNPQFVESFLREARAAAALSHPNVAQIYSFGEQNSRYYLVMELLTGGSLDDRIEKEHRVPEVEVLDVGMQVAAGLRAAHERGLIHRDIKPGNILFSEDGTAKVVDFGLARFESKTGPSTQEEGIWGTPYYIAPEKVSDNLEDFRSDIYSLGGTLFHALAGRAPFEAGSSTEVVLKHLHSPSVSLLTFTPDCTPQTAEAIGRMLKRDPAERPQSYDEVLNDLAYAKRFALEKKPPQKVEAESEYSTAMLVGTLVMMVLCITAAGVLWFYRYNIFPELATHPESLIVAPAPPSSPSKQAAHNPPPSPTPQVKPPSPPPAQPPPPPPPVNYAQLLENAHDLAGRGDLAAAIRQFDDLAKGMTVNHALHPWARLHAGRARLMAGRSADAVNLLAGVAGSLGQDGTLPSSVEEKQYPQFLALVLLGKVPDENIAALTPSMPDWMQMAVHLDAGLARLQKDQLAEGVKYWQAYDQMRAPRDERWVLSYRNPVFSFNTEFEDFRRMERQVNEQQGHFAEIQELLRANQSRWKEPFIRARVARITESNREAIANKQREDEEKNRAEIARQTEEENKLMDGARARRQTLLTAFQFEPLLEVWKSLNPSIKTEANRKELQKWLDYSQGLVDFKTGLYKDIAGHPYDQNRVVTRTNVRMSGELYTTRDDKLVFRTVVRNELGSATMESSCKWTDLTPMSIYELGDFYIMRLARSQEPSNSEVARRALLLAHFSRCMGLPEGRINQNLNLANRTGANMRDLYDRLFPTPPLK